eukprot:1618048-Rhodomonas_salina.1
MARTLLNFRTMARSVSLRLLEVLLLVGIEKGGATVREYNFTATVFPAQIHSLQSRSEGGWAMVAGVNGRVLGPAVHVCRGDRLRIDVRNHLGGGEGLSISWHGFQMRKANAYDGVVGVTQCSIPPWSSFVYDWEVEEEPGTYWWHTQSGALHLAQDLVKGPLVVHDCSDQASRTLVDEIYSGAQHELFYEDERIIFMTDVFNESVHSLYLEKTGRLLQDPSKSKNALAVGFAEWVGGLINGSPHASIPVPLGQSTLLRVINSATVFSLKFGVDQLRLTVVGTDGNPSEPFEVDEVSVDH